ncbi:hypothetical protein PanWU01x14_016870 [Parasponia andersonii]|uniref:Uncharacterized protein n=1 Tax=Parasponia andersonii TaxID=3476 RepID=A0A2P5DZR5_PARAD|nr:hypothetical protein PanWU01x14_016870 [Parasponia andersonii]
MTMTIRRLQLYCWCRERRFSEASVAEKSHSKQKFQGGLSPFYSDKIQQDLVAWFRRRLKKMTDQCIRRSELRCVGNKALKF